MAYVSDSHTEVLDEVTSCKSYFLYLFFNQQETYHAELFIGSTSRFNCGGKPDSDYLFGLCFTKTVHVTPMIGYTTTITDNYVFVVMLMRKLK